MLIIVTVVCFQGSPGNRGFPGQDGLAGPKVSHVFICTKRALIIVIAAEIGYVPLIKNAFVPDKEMCAVAPIESNPVNLQFAIASFLLSCSPNVIYESMLSFPTWL